MIFLLAILVAAALPDMPISPETWPLDTYVLEKIAVDTGDIPDGRWDLVVGAVTSEQETFRRAEVMVIGVVRSFSDTTGPDGLPWIGTDVYAERWLLGSCPDSVVTFYRPRARFSTEWERRSTRAEDGSLPEIGKRYLFIGTRFLSQPWVLRGGNRQHRYLIEDGIVVSKGIPVGELLEHVDVLMDDVEASRRRIRKRVEALSDTSELFQPPN